jgi:hypothetical protein
LIWLTAVAFVVACNRGQSAPDSSTGDEANLSAEDVKAIAEQAYVYAYPMLETYRTMFLQAIDRSAPGYLAPFNELTHKSELLGPEFKDIVRPNNDTMYSFGWLDLRAQPLVITVPEVADRYFSVQLVDMFTHNFAYLGTRSTGGRAGSYLITGPQWAGAKPGKAAGVFRSETEFVYCIVRIEVRGPDDVDAVRALQQGIRFTPLHVFLGRSRVPAASGITFPMYDADKAKSASFIDLLNFLLGQLAIPDAERGLMERFAQIGIRPGALSASMSLSPETRTAVGAGVAQALVKIREAATKPKEVPGVSARAAGGWQGVVGLFGDAAAMRGRYLARAVAAMMGLYGNDAAEAYYPVGVADASGSPLDGSKHDYVLRFDADALPQVSAFWSMTMYGLPDQLMVANPIERYSIGDRSQLRYDKDGSLALYIQHESPGPKRESNWLPAPDGPFSLQFRMYLPKPDALDPLYLPPPVEASR